MNDTSDLTARRQLLQLACALESSGLNQGTAGNASLRHQGGMLITPSGMKTRDTAADDLAWVNADGHASGRFAPSSEWRFHHDIYRLRPEAGAVVHAHSPYATALACHGREIPAFHYMIARFGGESVRCAPYATFGTPALSEAAMLALDGRCACLLANHGMLVFGRDTEHVLDLALELETLCQQYILSHALGAPRILDASQMADVRQRFSTYGQARMTGSTAD